MEIKHFTKEGRECFVRLTKHFNKSFFQYMISSTPIGEYLGLTEEFDKKLARIAFEKYENDLLDEERVIHCLFFLLKRCLVFVFEKFDRDKKEDHPLTSLFEGYLIDVLVDSCQVTQNQADTMARCVRKFSEIREKRDPIPTELCSVIENSIPLIGDKKSPLERNELEALQGYIGSKKNMYVHMLLGGLYEMGKHRLIFIKPEITEYDLIQICNSSWLYLTTFYYLQVDNPFVLFLQNIW